MRLFDFDDRKASHIGEALSVGTTLTTRLWVSLFSLSLALQLGLGQPSLFSHAGMQMFFSLVPVYVWGASMTVSGGLMLWRTFANNSIAWIAWFSNGFAAFLWVSIVLIRFVLIGYQSLASSSTIVALMAGWLLLRTEATIRDKETA
jgi:hypothetical protein